MRILSRIEILALLIKELNFKINRNDIYDTHKKLQNIIFILQEMGIRSLKYKFIYDHGVYSNQLENDVGEFLNEIDFYNNEIDNEIACEFKEKPKKIIENFSKIFNDKLNDELFMDSLTTLLMFIQNNNFNNIEDLKNYACGYFSTYKFDKIDECLDFIENHFKFETILRRKV